MIANRHDWTIHITTGPAVNGVIVKVYWWRPGATAIDIRRAHKTLSTVLRPPERVDPNRWLEGLLAELLGQL